MRFHRYKNLRRVLVLATMLQFLATACIEYDAPSTSDVAQANTNDYTPPSADEVTLDLDGLDALIADLEADEMGDDPCATCLVVAIANDDTIVTDAGVPEPLTPDATVVVHASDTETRSFTMPSESGSGAPQPTTPEPTYAGSGAPVPTEPTEPTEPIGAGSGSMPPPAPTSTTVISVIDQQCALLAPKPPKYGGELRDAWKLIKSLGEGFGKLAGRWATLGLKWSAVKLFDGLIVKISSRKWGENLNKLNDFISKVARIKGWDTATKLDKMFGAYKTYAKRTRSTIKIAVVTAVAMALAGKGFSWLWDQVNPWGSGKELEKAKTDLNKRIDDIAAKIQPNNMMTEEQKVAAVDELLGKIQKEADEIRAMPTCTDEQKKAKKDAFDAWKTKYAPYLDLIKGIKADLENADKAMKNAAELMGEIKKTLDGIAAADGDIDKYLAAALEGIPDDEADGLDAEGLRKAKADIIAGADLTPQQIASLGE